MLTVVLAGVGLIVDIIFFLGGRGHHIDATVISRRNNSYKKSASFSMTQEGVGSSHNCPNPLPRNCGDPIKYGGLISNKHFCSAMGGLTQEIVMKFSIRRKENFSWKKLYVMLCR